MKFNMDGPKKIIKNAGLALGITAAAMIPVKGEAQNNTNNKDKQKIGAVENKTESFQQKYKRYVTNGENMPELDLPVKMIIMANGLHAASGSRDSLEIQKGSAFSPNARVYGFGEGEKYYIEIVFLNTDRDYERIRFETTKDSEGDIVVQNYNSIQSNKGNMFTVWTPGQNDKKGKN